MGPRMCFIQSCVDTPVKLSHLDPITICQRMKYFDRVFLGLQELPQSFVATFQVYSQKSAQIT